MCNKKFKVMWIGNTTPEIVIGATISEALALAGYSNGCMPAVEAYEEIEEPKENQFTIDPGWALDLLIEWLQSKCKDGSKKHVIHNDADRHENHSFRGTMYLQHEQWKEFDPCAEEGQDMFGKNQPIRIHMSTCGGYGHEIGLIALKDALECEGAHPKEEAYYDHDTKKWCRVTDGFDELMNKLQHAGTEFSEWVEDMPCYM